MAYPSHLPGVSNADPEPAGLGESLSLALQHLGGDQSPAQQQNRGGDGGDHHEGPVWDGVMAQRPDTEAHDDGEDPDEEAGGSEAGGHHFGEAHDQPGAEYAEEEGPVSGEPAAEVERHGVGLVRDAGEQGE